MRRGWRERTVAAGDKLREVLLGFDVGPVSMVIGENVGAPFQKYLVVQNQVKQNCCVSVTVTQVRMEKKRANRRSALTRLTSQTSHILVVNGFVTDRADGIQ